MGALLLALAGSRLRVSYRTALTGCARDNGTGGASGVFRWADRIRIPVKLLEAPVWEAAQALPEPAGNCVLTMGNGAWSPMAEELEPEQWHSTRNWLARGNTLIVVTGAPGKLPAALRRDVIPATFIETAAQASPSASPGDRSVDNRPETTRAPLTSGGSLMVASKGPRWTARDHETPRGQMAADPSGGILFAFPVGAGALYVLLDEYAWTNAGFDQGDNARVLADLLHRETRGGVLAFDEYRHGHGRTESFLTYLLSLPGAPAFAALAVLWTMLYLYGRNVRLQPAEAYVERERRTAQEYIDAVAQLYERARAAPLVVEAVARRLRQLAQASAETPPSVAALLRSAEDCTKAADRPSVPGAAMDLVKGMIQLRKRTYGTRTVS